MAGILLIEAAGWQAMQSGIKSLIRFVRRLKPYPLGFLVHRSYRRRKRRPGMAARVLTMK